VTDQFLAYYNLRRSHQGYSLAGRTPAQALQEALRIVRAAAPGDVRRGRGGAVRRVGTQEAGRRRITAPVHIRASPSFSDSQGANPLDTLGCSFWASQQRFE